MSHTTRFAAILTVTALSFGLAACDRNDNTTVGQKVDSAVQESKQAAAEMRQDTRQAMNTAEAKIEQGTARMEAGAKDMGANAKATADEMTITAQVSAGLAKDPDLSAMRIDVDTNGTTVTLNGPAKTPEARERATEIAKNVKGVTSVVNNLTVGQG